MYSSDDGQPEQSKDEDETSSSDEEPPVVRGLAQGVSPSTSTNMDISDGYDWKFEGTTRSFKPKRFHFRGQEKTNFDRVMEMVLDYFSAMFDDTLIEKIVEWTNERASER